MNTISRHSLSILWIACAAFLLLLSACQPVSVATSLPTVQPTAAPLPTQPQAPTQPPAVPSSEFNLDLSLMAPRQTVETVAAVPPSADNVPAEAMPQYRRVTLQNYPVAGHSLRPQIFIYSAADLAGFNEAASQMAADLQALLQARQPVDRMPFLPLINSIQVMHPQVQYLAFKNGTGVRFLTQFNQGPVVINNQQLIYSFQGLTSDGKYYVAAILPVTHPELPAKQQVFAQSEADMKGFPSYLAKAAGWLDQLPGASFAPDLNTLDDLIQSIEVN